MELTGVDGVVELIGLELTGLLDWVELTGVEEFDFEEDWFEEVGSEEGTVDSAGAPPQEARSKSDVARTNNCLVFMFSPF